MVGHICWSLPDREVDVYLEPIAPAEIVQIFPWPTLWYLKEIIFLPLQSWLVEQMNTALTSIIESVCVCELKDFSFLLDIYMKVACGIGSEYALPCSSMSWSLSLHVLMILNNSCMSLNFHLNSHVVCRKIKGFFLEMCLSNFKKSSLEQRVILY